jgi:ethanolamine utilization protein EutA
MTDHDDRAVLLLGLDVGSTTTSALLVRARLVAHGVTGRMQFDDARVVFRAEPAFTPFADDEALDLDALDALFDGWLREAGVDGAALFAGGAIVTGLAAQRRNAGALRARIRSRIGDAVIATADDPRLESWVAFMGACAPLSRAFPDVRFLNLDIGGGTTNAALGADGHVLATACHFIGARHVRVAPGTQRVLAVSKHAARIAAALGLALAPGRDLDRHTLARFVNWQVRTLEAIVTDERGWFAIPPGDAIVQAAFEPAACGAEPADTPRITFSGGVGELVYALAQREPAPATARWGDLGIELARAIVASPILAADLATHVPEHRGRATVHGLTLHHTEVSGSTLHLPASLALPLQDLPVVARLPHDADRDAIAAAVAVAARCPEGACVQWLQAAPGPVAAARVRAFAADLRAVLDSRLTSQSDTPAPLVLLVAHDCAKALGNDASRWGRTHRHLAVIDEIPDRRAHFVHVGRARDGLVPLAFHGFL